MTCRCGGTVTEQRVVGHRGMRVRRCGDCGRSSLPYRLADVRARQRLERAARRAIEGPYAPSVPAPRSRTGWTPNEAIPRGERD
ncbi:MAG: hypothetical protein WC273_00470 [Dehalococcoidia bacterium]